MELRDYQKMFVASAVSRLDAGDTKVIGEAATGAGKSIMLASIASEVCGKGNVLILQRQEVISTQNYNACAHLSNIKPFLISSKVPPLGFFNVFFCTEGVAYNRIDAIKALDIKYIFIDEAHQFPFENPNSQYMQILKAIPAQVLGVTGSPVRGSGVKLGDSSFWHDEYFASIHADDLIERNYLTEYIVKSQNADAIEEVVLDEENLTKAVTHFVENTKYRTCTNIIFAKNKSDAKKIVFTLRSLNQTAEFVQASTPETKRQNIIKDSNSGSLRYIVNIDLCSTGWDIPRLGQLAWMRKMGSAILAIQSLGRILRLHELKDKAVAYDYCNVFTTNRSYFRKRMVEESLFNYDRGECSKCESGFTTINGNPVEPQCFTCGNLHPELPPIIMEPGDHNLYDEMPVYLFGCVYADGDEVDKFNTYNSCNCCGNDTPTLTKITKGSCRACQRILGGTECLGCRKPISSNTSYKADMGYETGHNCRKCHESKPKKESEKKKDERAVKHIRLSKDLDGITVIYDNPIPGVDEVFRASYTHRETGVSRTQTVGALALNPDKNEISKLLKAVCGVTYIEALSSIKVSTGSVRKAHTFRKTESCDVTVRDIKILAAKKGWL